MNQLDLEKFKPLLGDWWFRVEKIFASEQMYNLYQELKQISSEGAKITPKSSDLWRFMKECPPSMLKVVIIGMDAYPGMYKTRDYHADGIAFSNSYSPDRKCQPSLTSFWEGLSEDLDMQLEHKNDLKFLANQGILLGNRAFACKLNKTGSLMGKFDFFWEFFLQEIMPGFNGVPIILVGKDAQYLKRYCFEFANPVFEISHPSYAARKNETWDTEKVFSKVQTILKHNNNESIDWTGNNPATEQDPF